MRRGWGLGVWDWRLRAGDWRLGSRAVVMAIASMIAATIAQSQTDATAKLPGVARETDTSTLIATDRLKTLPDAQRHMWEAYLERSRVAQRVDQALLLRELQALGRGVMMRAALLSKSFEYGGDETDAMMASESAHQLVLSMLSYQTPSGGWSKHVDFTRGVRQPGQSFFSENEKWQYIATIGNDATTPELRFLMHRERVRPDATVRASVARGVAYLLAAQFSNGCWPQVWPLQGSYHDAATFNDDAIVEVLQLLDAVARGSVAYVSDSQRKQALGAVVRGIDCMLHAACAGAGRGQVDGVGTAARSDHACGDQCAQLRADVAHQQGTRRGL